MILGHEVGSRKRTPSNVKVKATHEFPTTSIKAQIRSFMGMTGYYSHHTNP